MVYNQFVFNHIPKCAGTSLKSLFKAKYKDKCYTGNLTRQDFDDIFAGKYVAILPSHIEICIQQWAQTEHDLNEFLGLWHRVLQTSFSFTVLRHPKFRFQSLINQSRDLVKNGEGPGWFPGFLPLNYSKSHYEKVISASKEYPEKPPSCLDFSCYSHPSHDQILHAYLETISDLSPETSPLFLNSPIRELAGQAASLNCKLMTNIDSYIGKNQYIKKNFVHSGYPYTFAQLSPAERFSFIRNEYAPDYDLLVTHENIELLSEALELHRIVEASDQIPRYNVSSKTTKTECLFSDGLLLRYFLDLPIDWHLWFLVDMHSMLQRGGNRQ